MENLIFLEPIFHEKIWGGTRLKKNFNYEIPSEKTGECWAISAHKNGDCKVLNGEHAGKTLSTLWKDNRELFGNVQGDEFPLLTKILDASDDLSVQVHPDDEYGLQHEGEMGKTECWYILDADEGAELIFGHHAQTKEEFINLIKEEKWDTLLRKVKIKKGDFFHVPTGTIHALKKGTLVLETQQSSDTTYRLYDYDRLGDDGMPRLLHLKQSIDVATIPHVEANLNYKTNQVGESMLTNFVTCDYFTTSKWDIRGTFTCPHTNPFTLVSVLDGEGLFNDTKIVKGQHFIVPSHVKELTIEGSINLIVASL
ncbi:mannose-6-phosphate isomerase, class I [Turicibacter sanguinis]|uniref:mannose-6-phosphate isomerase, class I n=1 Tax=Turicibacter sanguinis TaxID=154288 RepID=UPI0021D4FA3D|nr:mannose-6-phosphate isomerase, class I [Turicibacter sanguinis]MCU7198006.1 mannose-6-phosphate isomerase, class I [Turicibacter sanguinis]